MRRSLWPRPWERREDVFVDDTEASWREAEGVESELHRLIEVAVLCNDSRLVEGDGGKTLDGSATENALVVLAFSHALLASFPQRIVCVIEKASYLLRSKA